MAVEGFEFVVPSAEADRKQLKIMIEEAVSDMIKADGFKDHKKEVIASIREQFKIDASILNKVIAMRHKQTFTTVAAKQEATSELYTILYGDPTVKPPEPKP
jgi:hypothetical protein